jgi:hypothetical protein
LAAWAAIALWGCDIRDEAGDCALSVVSLYSQTPCDAAAEYPESIDAVNVLAFDGEGILYQSYESGSIKALRDYSLQVPLPEGLYNIMAWSGLDGNVLDMSRLKAGTARAEDIIFSLRASDAGLSLPHGTRIYCGVSAPLIITDDSRRFDDFRNTAVNMLEITNRVNVVLDGLPDPADYEAVIETTATAMCADGTLAVGAETQRYIPESYVRDLALTADFTLLKLDVAYDNMLVIRSKADGKELFRGSLLGTLLLKNPYVNPQCQNDFTIRFTADDICECGTYMITEIWVNSWLVHSYDANL